MWFHCEHFLFVNMQYKIHFASPLNKSNDGFGLLVSLEALLPLQFCLSPSPPPPPRPLPPLSLLLDALIF